MPIREVRKDGDSESEKEREVHMEKKLFHYEVRLSKTESRMLHNNAHLAGMPCSEYLRTLIKGFVPKQMPNKDFHDVLQRRYDSDVLNRTAAAHLQHNMGYGPSGSSVRLQPDRMPLLL